MSSDPSVGLPDIDWPDQAIIEVDTGDANAVITRFVVHLSQDVPPELVKIALLPPILASTRT